MSLMLRVVVVLGAVLGALGCAHSAPSPAVEDGGLRVYAPLPSRAGERVAATPKPAETESRASGASRSARAYGLLSVETQGAGKCALEVGGKKLGYVPLKDKKVAAGPQRIAVTCPNNRVYSETVELEAGQSQKIVLTRADFDQQPRSRSSWSGSKGTSRGN
jgi:hypothetical protein